MDIASLGIRIDSSQVKDATSSMDKLAAIGGKVQSSIASTAEGSKKLSKQLSDGQKAIAANNRSIDEYVKSLQVAAATAGLGARETTLYTLALKGANSAQLQAADSALRMNEAYTKGIEIGDTFKKGLSTLGAVIGTGLIAAAVAVEAFIHKAAEFQDLAEKTGDSAQNIASLAVAAGTAGVSMERIANFSVKLSKGLTGVDDESKAAGAAITALGLDLETFKNLKPADQVEQLGKALNSFKDSGAKASALEALSKGSADLLPFLKELGQEGGRQVILTEEQIRLADDHADKQAKLRTQLTLSAEAIATQMLPAYNAFSEVLVDIAKEILDVDGASKKLGKGGEIREFAERAAISMAHLADAGYLVSQTIVAIGESYGAAAAAANQFAHLNFSAGTEILRSARAQGDAMRLNLGLADRLQAKFAATSQASAAANGNPENYSNEGRSSAGGKTLEFDGRVKTPKKASSGAQEAKAQLSLDIEEIRKASDSLTNIYSNAERMIEAERSAGLVNEKEYYAAKLGLLNLNTQAQESALQAELARLKAETVTGKSKLENDRKIIDVEAKIAKLRQSSATSVDILAIQEKTALDSTARAYEEARRAAQDYYDTTMRGYARTLGAFGRGDDARNRASSRNQIEDKYSTQAQNISQKAAFDKDQSPDNQDRYKRLLDLNEESRRKALEGWEYYYRRLKIAEGDWTNGATRAMENYIDVASNTSKQVDDLFTNAFKGAEDALASFVKTGKLDFSSLTDSIISDLIRIQARKLIAGFASGFSSGFGNIFGGSGSTGGDYTSGMNDAVSNGWTYPSYDGGGYTGSSSRSGGIDGKGGFISIMHPQESVIDHTKGQSMGGGDVSVSVSVDASGSSAQGSDTKSTQLGAMIGSAVRSVILQEKMPGGMLS